MSIMNEVPLRYSDSGLLRPGQAQFVTASGCFRPEADQHVEDVGSAARSVSGGGPGAVVD
jgi:hypothetical protein